MKKMTMAKTRFDRHFVVRYYAIFGRAVFNRRSQEEGETSSRRCIA